jgi:hypothetical protein
LLRSGRKQSAGELERIRTEIDELKEEIKKSPDVAERTAMRNLLLTLEQRVNFLMLPQGESLTHY